MRRTRLLHARAKEQEAGRDQQQPQQCRARRRTGHELAVGDQHAEALRGDGGGNGGEHGERREPIT